MARRRFRSNQRHEPTTERSFQEYILSTPAPQTSRTELLRLIRGGEDTFLELKVKLSNTEKIAQEIVALANTGGGVMVFVTLRARYFESNSSDAAASGRV